MKALLLSVALLFFTGAQGRYFWQNDEPKQEETNDKGLEKILHDSFAIVFSLFEHMDYASIAKEYQIKERWDSARKHLNKLEKAVDSYYDEVYKKFDEQLHEKFPVFRKNVVPILKEFDDALEDQLEKFVKKVVPVGTDLVGGISRHVVKFFESLESIAEEGRDKLREEIDKLRVKVQPYVDDVHAEYEKYRANLQGEFEKDMKELKQEMDKNMEILKEKAKPHLENLKSKFPDGQEFQEKVEQFLKELKKALSEEE
ncbi:apolipoprotein A-I-like [Ranitomeya imitator]|uniref:apolipoprotein A-I-like n=1 Tax=Ranitomeya imitator TaxID=111125 RepID=UPI001AA23F1A